jgi:hypothetical protein
MPTWKRLTQDLSIPVEIDVNMDAVATMVREGSRNYTRLVFIFASGEKQAVHAIHVKETPDEIHTLPPRPSR